jgi:hypothetical protein
MSEKELDKSVALSDNQTMLSHLVTCPLQTNIFQTTVQCTFIHGFKTLTRRFQDRE